MVILNFCYLSPCTVQTSNRLRSIYPIVLVIYIGANTLQKTPLRVGNSDGLSRRVNLPSALRHMQFAAVPRYLEEKENLLFFQNFNSSCWFVWDGYPQCKNDTYLFATLVATRRNHDSRAGPSIMNHGLVMHLANSACWPIVPCLTFLFPSSISVNRRRFVN